MFDLKPKEVTPLYGRTFAAWTSVTCLLCLFCANDISNPGIYTATMLSFLIAFVHFTFELLVGKTVSLKKFLSPGIISTVSMTWMYLQKGFYLNE